MGGGVRLMSYAHIHFYVYKQFSYVCRRQALLCLLAKNCSEAGYIRLIEALCNEHNIKLLKVLEFYHPIRCIPVNYVTSFLCRTTKFKSANTFAMAIWDPTTKFNSCQYFWLYGICHL